MPEHARDEPLSYIMLTGGLVLFSATIGYWLEELILPAALLAPDR